MPQFLAGFFSVGKKTRILGVVVPLKLEGVLGTMTSLQERIGAGELWSGEGRINAQSINGRYKIKVRQS